MAARIGITLGDVNGIGPEVALRAVNQLRGPARTRFVLIGNADVLAEQARHLHLPIPPTVSEPDATTRHRVVVWDPAPARLRWTPGRLVPAASAAAAAWIAATVQACLRGQLHGMVTAPISKEGFHRAGINVPGHTELLAKLCDTKRFAMMLFGGPLRVVLATRHIPLAEVPRHLTAPIIEEAIELTAQALPWLGATRARVAVCGLNPHAGEGGDLGREEIDVIAPVIRKLRARGRRVIGPLPGDTVFHQAARGDYDAVVAMYHDQGLAPLKLIAFDSGVNLTLGLPIVRTSPDHGTAFAIAGKNQANPASMLEALRWAVRLAGKRNPWGK
jgi:4-hydroxythreonine-4-phosphate dehydrogenase